MYFKNYRFRVGSIAVHLLILVSALLASFLLCARTITKSHGILSSYRSVSFEYGYVLNYAFSDSDVLIYPDTDISFFVDENETNKITACSVMKPKYESQSDLTPFDFSKLPDCRNVIVPANIAKKYDLSVGDSLFCSVPYSDTSLETKIVDICSDCYDFSENAIENDVGLLALGYDEEFVSSVKTKYLLLSEERRSADLSPYPQILQKTFTKGNFLLKGKKLLVFPLVVYFSAFLISNLSFWLTIGKRTLYEMPQLYKLGTRKTVIRLIPIIEALIFLGVPFFLLLFVSCYFWNWLSIGPILSCVSPMIIVGISFSIISLVKLRGGSYCEGD